MDTVDLTKDVLVCLDRWSLKITHQFKLSRYAYEIVIAFRKT